MKDQPSFPSLVPSAAQPQQAKCKAPRKPRASKVKPKQTTAERFMEELRLAGDGDTTGIWEGIYEEHFRRIRLNYGEEWIGFSDGSYMPEGDWDHEGYEAFRTEAEFRDYVDGSVALFGENNEDADPGRVIIGTLGDLTGEFQLELSDVVDAETGEDIALASTDYKNPTVESISLDSTTEIAKHVGERVKIRAWFDERDREGCGSAGGLFHYREGCILAYQFLGTVDDGPLFDGPDWAGTYDEIDDLILCIREASRAAHRERDAAAEAYEHGMHAHAARHRHNKEWLYQLKEQGIAFANLTGLLRYMGATKQGLGVYEYGNGGRATSARRRQALAFASDREAR